MDIPGRVGLGRCVRVARVLCGSLAHAAIDTALAESTNGVGVGIGVVGARRVSPVPCHTI